MRHSLRFVRVSKKNKKEEKVARIPAGDAVKSRIRKEQRSELAAGISRISVNLEKENKVNKSWLSAQDFQAAPLTLPDFSHYSRFHIALAVFQLTVFVFCTVVSTQIPEVFFVSVSASCMLTIQKNKVCLALLIIKKKKLSVSAGRFAGPCHDLVLTLF